MFRKSFISLLFVVGLVFAASSALFGQTAPVSGTVELHKADGTREPVAGALVEVYRTDIKTGFPSAKTNKKGEFSFAGLPLGASFVFSVSAPGAAPKVHVGVKAGQEKILIIMSPGDGTKLTADEARRGAAAPAPGAPAELTAEQKKAQADYEAEKKKVEEKNQKALKTNEIVAAALKAGNDAFIAKNYDMAVLKFDEGYAADPDYVGSAPVFLRNKGIALTARAVDTHNAGIKLADAAEKAAAGAKVRKDLVDASEGYLRAWNLLKNAPAADIVDRGNYESTKTNVLLGAIDAFRRAVDTEKSDPAIVEAAKILVPEYLAAETDAAKKAHASLTLAHLYRISENREEAVAAYKKILETDPGNADALAYVGIMLVDLSWLKDNDKELSQEGANYLQKFVSVAPDTHKLKTGAVEYLAILKTQSVVPVKQATPAKRKP